MNLNQKRIGASLLLTALLLGTLASCGGDSPNQVQTDAGVGTDAGTAAPAETAKQYGDALPEELDFGGKEFRVATYNGGNLTNGDGWFNYIDVPETNGDILNDAAYERNAEVEERLNIEINCYEIAEWGQVLNALQKSVTAGDDAYDIAIEASHASYVNLISSNMLYDTNDLQYMDLSKPYYTKSSYETYEIDGHRYLFSGAYTYPLFSGVYWLFNKKMWTEYDLPDAYQTVRDGNWTFDTAFSYIKGTYRDLNGDSKADIGDSFGFSTGPAMLNYMYLGMGMKGVILGEDGFTYDYEDERAVDVVNKIIEWRNSSDAYYDNSKQWDNFFSGNSLMLLYGSSLSKLRDLEFDFGFLPMPKYDEAQTTYASYMCGGLVCVPTTISDPDCVGAAIEALFSASGRLLEPAYLEKFVENKVLRDEGSVEMYRLMLETASYDFTRYISPNASVQNFGLIGTLVNKKSTDIASAWAKVEKRVKDDFNEFYDEFVANSQN
ncbi:MAG: hypothetical protein E7604_05560 [Ruminococcaceae bacterium]|nr:hypothetical protein [Oscillospiraceae bacterium]